MSRPDIQNRVGKDAPFPSPESGLKSFDGDDVFPWPWRFLNRLTPGEALSDGGAHASPPPGYTSGPGRAKYSATRIGATLFVTAEGDLPNLNQIADLRLSKRLIFPPQIEFVVYTPPITLPALRHFQFTQAFGFPKDTPIVVVNDADGSHQVRIGSEQLPASKASTAREETSMDSARISMGLGDSLQDAFEVAVAQLSSVEKTSADALVTYAILESGLMMGGIAGLRKYFARVELRAPDK